MGRSGEVACAKARATDTPTPSAASTTAATPWLMSAAALPAPARSFAPLIGCLSLSRVHRVGHHRLRARRLVVARQRLGDRGAGDAHADEAAFAQTDLDGVIGRHLPRIAEAHLERRS